MKPLSSKDRRRLELSPVYLAMILGKRGEIQGKPGLGVVYVGQSSVSRHDPYWFEHKGGRTYKETPLEVLAYLLPHVGFAAIEKAKVH